MAAFRGVCLHMNMPRRRAILKTGRTQLAPARLERGRLRGGAMNSSSGLLEKHWRIIAVVAGVAIAFWIVYSVRLVMLPFFFGLALAYITIPLVSWVEVRFPGNGRRARTRRVSAIAIVYVLFVLLLGVFSFFVVSAIIDSVHTILHGSDDYFLAASDTLKQATQPLRQIVPADLRGQMDTYIQEMGDTLLDAVHLSVMNGMKSLPSTLGLVLGFAGVPFFLFYVLKDREKLSDFYCDLPSWAAPHVRNILSIVADVFGRWIRASLLLGLVVGTMDLIGLLIIGAPMALLLAVFAGVTEMVPIVGPWIGGAVAILVTLALAPEKVLWVAVIFLSVQLLENVFLVPRIHSSFFRIHPAVTIVLLTVGFYIAGAWGIIFILPLAAAVVGIYKYCSQLPQVAATAREQDTVASEGQLKPG